MNIEGKTASTGGGSDTNILNLEAKGNRWYNLKDCMKTKPRQLKKSFSV